MRLLAFSRQGLSPWFRSLAFSPLFTHFTLLQSLYLYRTGHATASKNGMLPQSLFGALAVRGCCREHGIQRLGLRHKILGAALLERLKIGEFPAQRGQVFCVRAVQ